MSREVHVRFCERREVRLLPATHLVVLVHGTEAHARAIKQQTAEFMAEQMRMTLSPEKPPSPTSTTALTCSGSASCERPGEATSASPTPSQANEQYATSCTASRR